MTQPPLTLRRWSRAEYERLVDLCLFQSDPVELIGGQVVVAEPQSSYHATVVGAADDALRAILPPGWMVNLIDRVLEVYRDPRPDPSAPHGWPAMIRAGGGAIVNVSSISALRPRGLTAYSASKGAVIALTRAMAVDHGPDGIRVNCVAPGPVYT